MSLETILAVEQEISTMRYRPMRIMLCSLGYLERNEKLRHAVRYIISYDDYLKLRMWRMEIKK